MRVSLADRRAAVESSGLARRPGTRFRDDVLEPRVSAAGFGARPRGNKELGPLPFAKQKCAKRTGTKFRAAVLGAQRATLPRCGTIMKPPVLFTIGHGARS